MKHIYFKIHVNGPELAGGKIKILNDVGRVQISS